MKRAFLFLGAGLLTFSAAFAASPSDKAAAILSKMTLEEKIGQLTQYSGSEVTGPQGEKIDISEYLKAGKTGSLLNIYGTDQVRKYQKIAVESSKLGIPLIFGMDIIHGYKTIFPVPLALASSWDKDSVLKAQKAAGLEASSAGISWTFTPMVDIARDPRWGRVVEGFGEDPYLTSELAAASVEGFQGADLKDKNSMLATAKHYVGYGACQAGRDYFTVDISERTLWEVYLPPFIAAIEAGAATVMPAFTTMNGIPMTANKYLLRDVLRDKIGFTGITVSDWNAINELIEWHVAKDQEQAALEAIDAGVDIDMMSSAYINQLAKLVEDKKVPESIIDEAVLRILIKKFELGLFDDPYRYCNSEEEARIVLSKEMREKSRDTAKRCMVLLKNNSKTLPLKKDISSIAVVGPLAEDSLSTMGPWSAAGSKYDVVTLFAGLKNAVSKKTTVSYSRGCDIDSSDTSMIEAAVNNAKNADVIIAALGESYEMSGEAASRSQIGLPGVQEDLLKALYNTGKPIVLVLFNGRPLTIDWADKHVQAIVEVWFPGTEGGNAIADVLFGDYNPSGRLPITFPRSVGQIPIFYSHLNTGRPATPETKMLKYVSKYLDVENSPLYPFGYGLSYTSFEYSDITLSAKTFTQGSKITASVEVRNTGSKDGEEVVQFYVMKSFSPIARPMQLKGFKKVMIPAGEKVEVSFDITEKELALYDEAMKKVVESGSYDIMIGKSSVDFNKTNISVQQSGDINHHFEMRFLKLRNLISNIAS